MDNLQDLAAGAAICTFPIAIAAIIVTIVLWRRGRKEMALSLEFQQITSPVEVRTGSGLEGDINILYKGQPVENLFVVQARLVNSGNLPVSKDEIIRPIVFRFAEDVRFIKNLKVIDMQPDDMKLQWHVTADELNASLLRFDLMNPGDHIIFELVCTGSSGVPAVSSGIEGLKAIKVLEPGEALRKSERGYPVFQFVTAAILAITLTFMLLRAFGAEIGITFPVLPGIGEVPAIGIVGLVAAFLAAEIIKGSVDILEAFKEWRQK